MKKVPPATMATDFVASNDVDPPPLAAAIP